MLPARPVPPRLSALTNPPLTMLNDLPAVKDTPPPLPLPRVFVDIVLPVPDTEISVPVILTVPPVPVPTINLPLTVWPLAEVTLPPFWTLTSFALREILPAVPLPIVVVEILPPVRSEERRVGLAGRSCGPS